MSKATLEAQVLTTLPLFMRKVFGDFLPPTGDYSLNKTQIKALMIIDLGGRPNMTEVCRHMNIEKGSLTSVVDGLKRLGLVGTQRNAADRRKVNLTLTRSGRALVDRIHRTAHAHLAEKTRHLPPDDVERFRRALHDLREIAAKL